MIHILQSYCIISTGVRITCSNQNGQGKRSTVLSTSSSQSIRDNIGAIFGPKQVCFVYYVFAFYDSLNHDRASTSEEFQCPGNCLFC